MYLNRCCTTMTPTTTTTSTTTTTTCWYHWPKFKSGICSRRQKDRHKHIQTWRQKHRPTKRETDRQTDRRPKQKKRLFWRNSLVGVFFLSASRRLIFFSTKFVLPSLPPTALAFVSRPFGLRYNFHFRRRWRRQRRQRRRRRRCRIFLSRRRVDSKKGTSVFLNDDEQVRCRHVSTKSCLSDDVEAELGFEPVIDEFETPLRTMRYHSCQVSLLWIPYEG